MGLIPANGTEIAYEADGPETGSPILLTRGLGTQLIEWPEAFWRGLVDSGYRVLRYDNRDTGLSQKFGPCEPSSGGQPQQAPYSLFDMADDAIGLLDRLDVRRAHILGISMGGMISQIIAARYPERTTSLISIMSSAGQPNTKASSSPSISTQSAVR